MRRIWIVLAAGWGTVALLALLLGPLASAHDRAHRPANLVVSKVAKPAPVMPVAGSIKLVVRVANKSAGKAGKSRLGIYLESTGGKGRLKRGFAKYPIVEALGPHESATLRRTLSLPAGLSAGLYSLTACADDRHQLRESDENDNCRGAGSVRLVETARQAPSSALPSSPTQISAPPPTPTLPTPPTAPSASQPAFTTTDQISWGFAEDATRHVPAAGDPVTGALRVANGLAGQTGYTHSAIGAEPLLSGSTTTLNFGTHLNDGAVAVELPFDFPFGGVAERFASISTNGWVEFGGSPAFDYWGHHQKTDYRGSKEVLGNFERGIMPYMADLDLADAGAGTGTVKMVVPASRSSVAFQWNLGQQGGGGAPRRIVQAVLFPDGSFRFDYPGANPSGGGPAFIGYTLGTGAGSFASIATDATAVPAGSRLFLPKAVPPAAPLAAATATLTLPRDSSFVSADPGCGLTSAPSALTEGLVSCSIPSLSAGTQATRNVTFSMPGNAPGSTHPANLRYVGSYAFGGLTLSDRDEIDTLTGDLPSTALQANVQYASGAPEVGVPAEFETSVSAASGGMDGPEATFTLPKGTTLDSVEVSGQALPCTTPVSRQFKCELPSGAHAVEALVTVTPLPAAAASPMTLLVSADALNAPADTGEASSPSLPAPVPAPDPILFVHGWHGTAGAWGAMVPWFEEDGWPWSYLATFTYDTSASNKVTAQQEIAQRVATLRNETGAEKVDLITHSMGALNTRWYIKFLGGDQTVDDWVSLGGPNHGTTQAASPLCGGTTACEEMEPGSGFLSELNAGDETPGTVNYATWWTPCDELVLPPSSTILAGASNHETACMEHGLLGWDEAIYEQVRDFVE